ncbi:hypothetical protein DKM44_03825 [Deinococcus irradiatisoli]|uniref:Uncharacterized protein n=1 Tax=Deinococcus irradiatisoli TaxID=2202254 RepID=A0A2Z3JG63_9DEIO|nr:hypothetical protein [Deinococcus irradiatisoli]AWN22471.1 hypothetical protein DKM44_03825 [Deinococcus irradiatisoli]
MNLPVETLGAIVELHAKGLIVGKPEFVIKHDLGTQLLVITVSMPEARYRSNEDIAMVYRLLEQSGSPHLLLVVKVEIHKAPPLPGWTKK